MCRTFAGSKVDVWGAATVLYFMLTGHHAFEVSSSSSRLCFLTLFEPQASAIWSYSDVVNFELDWNQTISACRQAATTMLLEAALQTIVQLPNHAVTVPFVTLCNQLLCLTFSCAVLRSTHWDVDCKVVGRQQVTLAWTLHECRTSPPQESWTGWSATEFSSASIPSHPAWTCLQSAETLSRSYSHPHHKNVSQSVTCIRPPGKHLQILSIEAYTLLALVSLR